MTMFYKNCSPRVQEVPVGDGNVVAVRPGDVVEVVLETAALKRLLGSRKVVRTGRPVQPMPKRAAPVEPAKPVEPPKFAQVVQDKPEPTVAKPADPKPVEMPVVQTTDAGRVDKKRKGKKRS